MPEDVFQHHDIVVEQGSDHQREPAESHHVHRLSGLVEEHERPKDGKRDGERDQERGANAAEE